MTQSSSQPPAGWYPDPAGSDGERFWDGVAWSQSTRDKPRPPMPPTGPGAPSFGQGPYGQAPYGQQAPYAGYGYPMGAPQGPQLAGFWWRLLGKVIDNIVTYAIYWVLAAVTGIAATLNHAMESYVRELLIWVDNPNTDPPLVTPEIWQAVGLSGLLAFVISAAYRTILYGTMSATLGQLAIGAKVVKDGEDVSSKLSWSTAAVRGIVGGLLWEVIGWINGIFAAFTQKKQTLGDMIAKTLVYKVR